MDADDWNRRYESAGLVWSAEPNRFLVEEVAELAPGRALDLACGEGRNAVWLARRGWDVIGVDFSSVALATARSMADGYGVAVRFVLADLTAYLPDEAAFDLVIVMYLHVPAAERDAVLARAAAAVAPGGVALVVGHADTNATRGFGGPSDPRVLYGPDEVAAALGGLRVERAERVRRPVATAGGPRFAIDALVRARRTSAGGPQTAPG